MRKRRSTKPRLTFEYVQAGRRGTLLTDSPWYEVDVGVGWVWRGEEEWGLKEGEKRMVVMELSNRVLVDRVGGDDEILINNRLIAVGVEGEVTLFVGWEDV